MNVNELNAIVEELRARVEKLENAQTSRRGPKSEHEMSDDDARKIMSGELKGVSHKEAAEKLGLSYAQVYSCRKGFTFKHIHKELEAANK